MILVSYYFKNYFIIMCTFLATIEEGKLDYTDCKINNDSRIVHAGQILGSDCPSYPLAQPPLPCIGTRGHKE